MKMKKGILVGGIVLLTTIMLTGCGKVNVKVFDKDRDYKLKNVVENDAKEEVKDEENSTSNSNNESNSLSYTDNLIDAQNGKVAFEKIIKDNALQTEKHGDYYTYIDQFGNSYNIKEIKSITSEEGTMGNDNWAALFKVTVTYLDNNAQTKTMELAIILLPNHEVQNRGTFLNYTGTTSFVRGFTDLYADDEEPIISDCEYRGELTTADLNEKNPSFATTQYAVYVSDENSNKELESIVAHVSYKARDEVEIVIDKISVTSGDAAAGTSYYSFKFEGKTNTGRVMTGDGVFSYSNVIDDGKIGLKLSFDEELFDGADISTRKTIYLGRDEMIINKID